MINPASYFLKSEPAPPALCSIDALDPTALPPACRVCGSVLDRPRMLAARDEVGARLATLSSLLASGRPVVELPAEELADLVRGLDRRSSAPGGKLLEVGLAASEDEADGVVEGSQLDGAEVAGHIVAWSDLRTALRDLRREHAPPDPLSICCRP